ncbi:hypothetical protein GS506_12840 [Rhodococcus hoagii]|nr:hypothetical protein [Prescottella equi]
MDASDGTVWSTMSRPLTRCQFGPVEVRLQAVEDRRWFDAERFGAVTDSGAERRTRIERCCE